MTASRGFVVAEWGVALAIAGIISAAIASLVAWASAAQVRAETVTLRQEQVHQAASVIADLLREAGAAGRPALVQGEKTSVTLCGLPRGNRLVRGRILLDAAGRLVLEPAGNIAGFLGTDVAPPIDLAPEARFAGLSFQFFVSGRFYDSCSGIGAPPCREVTAVEFTLEPIDDAGQWNVQRVVALRNAGS